MSDYLGRLAARALGVGEVARPRRPLFEPRLGAVDPVALERPSAKAVQRSVEDPAEVPVELEARVAQTEQETPDPVPAPESVAEPARARPAPPELPPPAEAERPRAEPGGRPAPRSRPPAPRARPAPHPDAPAEPAPATPAAARAVEPAPLLRPPPPPLLRAHADTQAASPAVKVTIGRVEVRAVLPEPAREPRRRRPPVPKRMTLDEYLSKPQGRGR
jgi:Meckel syndrome type 1 protein